MNKNDKVVRGAAMGDLASESQGRDIRQVGKRVEAAASSQPSGAALEAGLSFSAGLSLFAAGRTFFPKGVFRYKSHEEANQHAAECLANGMAALAKERRHE